MIINVPSRRYAKLVTLREKCQHWELFWSAFSRFRTEYGEIRCVSPYSVRIRENADQNNSEFGHFLCSIRHAEIHLILSHSWIPHLEFYAILFSQILKHFLGIFRTFRLFCFAFANPDNYRNLINCRLFWETLEQCVKPIQS